MLGSYLVYRFRHLHGCWHCGWYCGVPADVATTAEGLAGLCTHVLILAGCREAQSNFMEADALSDDVPHALHPSMTTLQCPYPVSVGHCPTKPCRISSVGPAQLKFSIESEILRVESLVTVYTDFETLNASMQSPAGQLQTTLRLSIQMNHSCQCYQELLQEYAKLHRHAAYTYSGKAMQKGRSKIIW